MERPLSLPLMTLLLAWSPAVAQDVAHLVGARGSSGEMEMQNRGFAIARQQGLTSFWWSDRTNRCARIITDNGRYRTMTPIAASACEKPDSSSLPTPGAIKPAQMPRFCKGEAARKFGKSPQNISTQMPVPDHGMYSVFGQYPPNGAGTVFICTFTRDGKFVGVDRE